MKGSRPVLFAAGIAAAAAVAGLFFLFRGACPFRPNAAPPPEEPTVFDFGRIPEGEVAAHDFILRNDSQKKFTITSSHSSCGCTVSRIDKKVLRPGESSFIRVNFNSKGYSGPVEQYVYVNTDRPENPIIKYTIKAEVVKPQ